MPATQDFDPLEFKRRMREEWRAAAPGWRQWCETMETEQGGRAASEKLVELAGLAPGDRVLDLASGYGEPGLTAARAVAPGGHVLCADISAEMLAIAAERAERAGIDNVEFVRADAEELELDRESLDAVLSRAGLMYLPDVAGTLARLHGALRPGGRLAAAVWGAPESVQFAIPVPVILEELELPTPAADEPGLFALADPDRLAGLVEGAGFEKVGTGTVQVVYELASPEQLTRWIREVAPPITELLDGQPPAVQERVWQKVTEAWSATGGAPGHTENQAIWVAGAKR